MVTIRTAHQNPCKNPNVKTTSIDRPVGVRRLAAGADGCAVARRPADRGALGLQSKDVDPERGALVVLLGKGDKRRVVGIDPCRAERSKLNVAATVIGAVQLKHV